MHRTLYITEIIRYIFSFLDLPSNARNARVCKTWKDAALDATWRVVGPNVFRALAQMLRHRDDISSPIGLTFASAPAADEWRAFCLNCERVRIWDSRSEPSSRYRISIDAANTIREQFSGGLSTLFPHLHTILAASPEFYSFLIGASVSRLDIRLKRGPNSWLQYGHRLDSNMAHLRYLTIFYDKNEQLLDRSKLDLLSIVRHLPELEEVGLPFRYLDAPLAKALSQYKNVRRIFSDNPRPGARHFVSYWEMESLLSHDFRLEDGAFPALTSFHVPACTISEVYTYITGRFFPLRNITSLGIFLPVTVRDHNTEEWSPTFSDEELEDFISNLAAGCPSLETLELRLHGEKNTEGVMDELMPLTMKGLTRAILRFSRLLIFRIHHPYPIYANNSDIDVLSRQWPHLRGLHLSPCPLFRTGTNLSWAALHSLTTNCPGIEEIGLYINGVESDYRDRPRRPALLLPRPTKLWLSHASPLATHYGAVYETYPSIARYLASLPFSSCIWVWREDDSEKLEYTQRQYRYGWRTVVAMVDLILEAKGLV